MAFLRIDKKASGRYMRILQSYKEDGKSKHRTLYSLGKVEDYSNDQLENIANKLLELAGRSLDQMTNDTFKELSRVNYGYALVLQALWKVYCIDSLARKINNRRKVEFDWQDALRLMVAERINEPCSKLQSSFNQKEYFGLVNQEIALHHLYRTLDLLSSEEDVIKGHLFSQQHSLFSTVLDVVFYDVTTLYFESQVENEGELRQKGYSKDGKAHKTQIVLGLLVDKSRNPISYQVYQGNTYEGGTMIDALKAMKRTYKIDNVIVVADSAMIDKKNRAFMVGSHIDYIIGDSIKNLGKKIQSQLMESTQHKTLIRSPNNIITYREVQYKGRRIICTHSTKRARKDAYERQKLIDKANNWLDEPSKYNSVKKRGAGRFISTDEQGSPIALDLERIKEDERYDGYKAISTTTKQSVEVVLNKYRDLFEVEHTFRALKSQLEIRPVYHWTDKRIRGHICMSFIAFTFTNYLRNLTGLQYKAIVKAMDRMQMSHIKDMKTDKCIYLRSNICDNQKLLASKLKLNLPKDANPQSTINQYFT